MTTDPRAALDRLIAALEAHFDAVTNRRAEDDPRIEDTYDLLADAFEVYDDALSSHYNEFLPVTLDDSADDLGPEVLDAIDQLIDDAVAVAEAVD